MKKRIRPLLVCLLAPLAVGALAALCSMDGMRAFAALQKPPLTPPGWVFPIVWTALYLMMGFASYLVYTSGQPPEIVRPALAVYALSLLANGLWPVLFFALGLRLAALLCLAVLFLLVRKALIYFSLVKSTAGHLLFPYWLWTMFAGYLNLGVWLLNR